MFTPVSFFGKLFKWYLLFPAHPFKIRIENKLGNLFFKSGMKIKNRDGVVLKLDANDWITRTMIEQGSYEPDSIALGKKIVASGGVFIDVGANFGLYSCLLGFKNNELQIFSIEPNHHVLRWLTENVQNNLGHQQVQIINAAVAREFQLVFLEQAEKNNHGTFVTSPTNRGRLAVLSCPLEYILDSNRIKQVDLLKIDIEGNEFSVLENFPFEKYYVKNIILEFNFLSKIGINQLQKFLKTHGFDCFTITGKNISDDENDIPENNLWFINQKTERE